MRHRALLQHTRYVSEPSALCTNIQYSYTHYPLITIVRNAVYRVSPNIIYPVIQVLATIRVTPSFSLTRLHILPRELLPILPQLIIPQFPVFLLRQSFIEKEGEKEGKKEGVFIKGKHYSYITN